MQEEMNHCRICHFSPYSGWNPGDCMKPPVNKIHAGLHYLNKYKPMDITGKYRITGGAPNDRQIDGTAAFRKRESISLSKRHKVENHVAWLICLGNALGSTLWL